jgi:hypothetical protein
MQRVPGTPLFRPNLPFKLFHHDPEDERPKLENHDQPDEPEPVFQSVADHGRQVGNLVDGIHPEAGPVARLTRVVLEIRC